MISDKVGSTVRTLHRSFSIFKRGGILLAKGDPKTGVEGRITTQMFLNHKKYGISYLSIHAGKQKTQHDFIFVSLTFNLEN